MKQFIYIILLFIIITLSLYSTKPKLFFNKNKFKPFGLNKDETMFPFIMFPLLLSIIFYMFIILIKK